MDHEIKAYYFNERTQEFEYGFPDDPADLLPQIPAALGMYRLHLALGLEPTKAAINVLSKCLGEDAPFKPIPTPQEEA